VNIPEIEFHNIPALLATGPHNLNNILTAIDIRQGAEPDLHVIFPSFDFGFERRPDVPGQPGFLRLLPSTPSLFRHAFDFKNILHFSFLLHKKISQT